jgi:hypothetical protein
MNREESLYCFWFYDHRLVYNQIHSIAALQLNRFVNDMKRHLPPKGNVVGLQFKAKAFFMHRLQKARA